MGIYEHHLKINGPGDEYLGMDKYLDPGENNSDEMHWSPPQDQSKGET